MLAQLEESEEILRTSGLVLSKKVGSLLLQSLSDHSSNDWDVKKIFQGL